MNSDAAAGAAASAASAAASVSITAFAVVASEAAAEAAEAAEVAAAAPGATPAAVPATTAFTLTVLYLCATSSMYVRIRRSERHNTGRTQVIISLSRATNGNESASGVHFCLDSLKRNENTSKRPAETEKI